MVTLAETTTTCVWKSVAFIEQANDDSYSSSRNSSRNGKSGTNHWSLNSDDNG